MKEQPLYFSQQILRNRIAKAERFRNRELFIGSLATVAMAVFFEFNEPGWGYGAIAVGVYNSLSALPNHFEVRRLRRKLRVPHLSRREIRQLRKSRTSKPILLQRYTLENH